MSEPVVWIKEKGELRILGKRHTAVDVEAFCDSLDYLVGVQVAQVIMHNVEYRLGKLDGARAKMEKTKASLTELVDYLAQADLESGIGKTKVTLSGDPATQAEVEVANPCVRGTSGAARSFIASWWAGAITSLLDKEFDIKNVAFDQEKNIMKCSLATRP